MECFKLSEAARWTNGQMAAGAPDVDLCAVSTDSRNVPQGCLFVPLKGARFDGHAYIEQAYAAGAAAVLTAGEPLPGVPSVAVADTGRALLDLAAGYRAGMRARIIGVTGSVGKTTTKDMTASVLSQSMHTIKTQGNFNNEIGLPLSMFQMGAQTQAAVLEMGMNHFGELSRLTACARPDVAVITNIGLSHIEHFGSQEQILKAKLEILEGLNPGGVVLLCGDDPLLWQLRGTLNCRTVYYGIENPECDLTGENMAAEDDGLSMEICNRSLWDCRQLPTGQRIRARLHVPGAHNALAALAAAAAALELGLEPGDIVAGIAAFAPDGLRQHIYQEKGYTLFADCYNASPDSMEAALRTLKELRAPRRIAVLGGMLELGDYTREGHLRAGRAAAACADLLCLYEDGSGGAAILREGALEGGMKPAQITLSPTHEACAQALKACAAIGDAVLFKGSRGMHMERVLEQFVGE